MKLLYSRGTRSVDEIQREIDAFWDALGEDDELRADVRDGGIDVRVLDLLSGKEAIRVTALGAGLDPGLVCLVVAFAPAVNTIAVSAWKKVILPGILKKHGRDAIGPERPAGDGS